MKDESPPACIHQAKARFYIKRRAQRNWRMRMAKVKRIEQLVANGVLSVPHVEALHDHLVGENGKPRPLTERTIHSRAFGGDPKKTLSPQDEATLREALKRGVKARILNFTPGKVSKNDDLHELIDDDLAEELREYLKSCSPRTGPAGKGGGGPVGHEDVSPGWDKVKLPGGGTKGGGGVPHS